MSCLTSSGPRRRPVEGHVAPAPFGNRRPEVVMGAHGPRGLALAGQRAGLWLSGPQGRVDVVAGPDPARMTRPA
jgi:alkanesulfonate monooxygenase SsuD/methylene tetrahydromethanopterin reductase-like flavin-dependent oxidoreductase (luciferase family)